MPENVEQYSFDNFLSSISSDLRFWTFHSVEIWLSNKKKVIFKNLLITFFMNI